MNIVARPWEPQDLIDDLQMLIDEEPINYLNGRCATLCMARDYLKAHFAEPRWVSVEERLPERNVKVLCYMNFLQSEETKGWGTCITENTYNGMFVGSGHRKPVWEWQSDFVTHWMPLPDPPKEEV